MHNYITRSAIWFKLSDWRTTPTHMARNTALNNRFSFFADVRGGQKTVLNLELKCRRRRSITHTASNQGFHSESSMESIWAWDYHTHTHTHVLFCQSLWWESGYTRLYTHKAHLLTKTDCRQSRWCWEQLQVEEKIYVTTPFHHTP